MTEPSAPSPDCQDAESEHLQKVLAAFSLTLDGLSHDLREPVRTVRCYGELIARSGTIEADPDLSEYAYIIIGAADRLDTLISGIADYSQLLGTKALPFAAVDMNAVVQAALANLQWKIDESKATIVCDSLPQVLGDRNQLTRLVQNIVGNAIKYRGAAPPQISIEAKKQVDGRIVFSLADNGIGIDPQHHQAVFEPFRRFQRGELPGSGLGLAICRQIVELHGGRIWVDSAVNQGSIFYFSLAMPSS
jgi:chemotaxis family two-component system sensor kinase Cph1